MKTLSCSATSTKRTSSPQAPKVHIFLSIASPPHPYVWSYCPLFTVLAGTDAMDSRTAKMCPFSHQPTLLALRTRWTSLQSRNAPSHRPTALACPAVAHCLLLSRVLQPFPTPSPGKDDHAAFEVTPALLAQWRAAAQEHIETMGQWGTGRTPEEIAASEARALRRLLANE